MQANYMNQLKIPNQNLIDNNFNNENFLNNIYPEGNLSEEEDLQNLNLDNEQMDYATDSDNSTSLIFNFSSNSFIYFCK